MKVVYKNSPNIEVDWFEINIKRNKIFFLKSELFMIKFITGGKYGRGRKRNRKKAITS